jgi:hypothetical protein
MAIQTVSGSTIWIATTSGVATVDAAGFGAKTYTKIGEVSNIGDFGLTYNEVKFNDIGTRLTRKLRGSLDAGSQTIEMAYSPTDAGQIQLRTAFGTDNSWAFKIVMQDGSIFYYTAKVMTQPYKMGSIDSVVMVSCNLGIDSLIVAA